MKQVHINCDPYRKRQEPPDPWWQAARNAVAAGQAPTVSSDSTGRGLAFLITDPRPTGLIVTLDEANTILAWAQTLPGWEATHRPVQSETIVRRGKSKVRRFVGWTGHQLRREELDE